MKQALATLLGKLRQRPFLSTALVIYCLYLISFGLIIPQVLKNKLPELLEPFSEFSASVEDIRFNPFLLRLTIDQLEVIEHKEHQQKLSGLKQVSVNLQLSSIFYQALVISEFSLIEPYGRLTIDPSGKFLWETLSSHSTTAPTEETPATTEEQETADSTPFPLIIDHLLVQTAVLDFEDLSRATAFKKTIGPIDLQLENLSTLPQDSGNYQLDIVLQQTLPQDSQAARFKWQGDISLSPFQSKGHLELNQLAIRTVWDYIQDDVYYEPLAGHVNVGFDYQLMTEEQLEVTLNQGSLTFSDLSIASKGQQTSLLDIDSYSIKGIFFDLQKRVFSIEQAQTEGISVKFNRIQNGDLELIKVLSERPIREGIEEAAIAAASTPEETKPEEAWAVSLDDFQLSNANLVFQDLTTSTPATIKLSDITARVQDFSLTDQPVSVSLGLNIGANTAATEDLTEVSHFNMEGEVVVPNQTAQLQLDLKNLPINLIQPYLSQATALSIDSLLFDLNGQLAIKNQQANFDGSSQLRDIKFTNLAQSQAILAGKGLYFEGIHLRQAQKSLKIDQILLDQLRFPVTVISRDEQATVTNFSALVKSADSDSDNTDSNADAKSNSEVQTAEDDWLIEIGRVAIQDNIFQFSDRGLPRPVFLNIEQLNGVIDKLSSNNLSRADIKLAGQINGYAPFKVKGQINPLSDDAYTNIEVSMNGIAMSTFSPYTSHFLNYPLIQGKLSTDVSYRLNQSELEAENKLFIDQLELGKYVESDTGLGLPLPLAVSLLQTNSGEIDIDMPIKGNLDDPDFKYGQVVFNAMVNLITKAVASPFKLIANLAGSDADLSQLAFNPAQDQLTENEKDKALQLVEALNQRQSLKLSLIGVTNSQDQDALKQQQWQNKVASSGIQVNYQAPAYWTFLSQQATQTPTGSPPAKPADAVSAQTLEQSLIDQQTVPENLLAELAQQRATHTRQTLLAAGLNEKRIFIKETELSQNNDNIGVKLEIK